MKHFSLALSLFLPLCAFADVGLPSQPYIYVEGHGEAQRLADFVTLDFSVGVLDLDPAVANKKMEAQAAKIFALLDAEKIAEKDVVADNLQSEKQYARGDGLLPKKPTEFEGFHITRSFRVTVHEVGTFPRIIDKLLALGVETFYGPKEGLNNQPEFTAQVREEALADARQQAEKTLKSQQMKIDSVFAISPVVFTQISGNFFRDNPYKNNGMASMSLPDPTQFRLEPVSVTQTIHVIYLISPVK